MYLQRFGGVQLIGLLVALGLTDASAARAAEPVATGDAGSTAKTEGKKPTVLLTVHSDSTGLSREAVRDALAQELGAEVTLGDREALSDGQCAVVVSYRPGLRELAVTAIHPGRANTTRVVEAPVKVDDVVSVAALLARELFREPTSDMSVAPSIATTIAEAPPPSPAPSKPNPPNAEPLAKSPSEAVVPVEKAFATASFFYPAATNYDKPEIQTHFSFNVLYGHVGGLDGLELGLLVNTVSGNGRGVQWGGLGNWVGGSFEGWQTSLAFNSAKRLRGIQLSLGINTTRATEGLLLTGLANVARGKVTGFEGAFFNYAHDVSGVQFGFINIAKVVSGVQFGLINVADDIDGVPIGLISVTRSGGIHPMFWAGSTSRVNVGLKFATRYTYTFLNVSARPINDRWRTGPGFGIGVRVPALPKLFFEPDVSATHLIGNAACCSSSVTTAVARRRDESHLRLRSALRYEFAKHFSLFAGAAVLGRVTYPVVNRDTEVTVEGLLEGFGGVEL